MTSELAGERRDEATEHEDVAPCHACERPVYADLIVPCETWRQISPTGDLDGYLCPNCILERLSTKGLRCKGAIFAPCIDAVSSAEMEALRRVENIELALEGFRNRWGAALDDRIAEGGIDQHANVPSKDAHE